MEGVSISRTLLGCVLKVNTCCSQQVLCCAALDSNLERTLPNMFEAVFITLLNLRCCLTEPNHNVTVM